MLREMYAPVIELYDKRILVRLLVEAMTQRIVNREGAAQDQLRLFLAWKICVHLRPSAVD